MLRPSLWKVFYVWYDPKQLDFTASVLPLVTCNLPVVPVPFHSTWTHLSGLSLPACLPGFIDLLLGVNIFINTLCQNWRIGPLGCSRNGHSVEIMTNLLLLWRLIHM